MVGDAHTRFIYNRSEATLNFSLFILHFSLFQTPDFRHYDTTKPPQPIGWGGNFMLIIRFLSLLRDRRELQLPLRVSCR